MAGATAHAGYDASTKCPHDLICLTATGLCYIYMCVCVCDINIYVCVCFCHT
jgi:hypothetical protein